MSYELKDYMDNAAGVFIKPQHSWWSIEISWTGWSGRTSRRTDSGETQQYLSVYPEKAGVKDWSDPKQIWNNWKEEVSLSDKMLAMKSYAAEHRKFSFRQLLTSQSSRVQVIVTFLSILELMKMGYIHVQQDELFDDIQVDVIQDPETWTHLTEFADE